MPQFTIAFANYFSSIKGMILLINVIIYIYSCNKILTNQDILIWLQSPSPCMPLPLHACRTLPLYRPFLAQSPYCMLYMYTPPPLCVVMETKLRLFFAQSYPSSIHHDILITKYSLLVGINVKAKRSFVEVNYLKQFNVFLSTLYLQIITQLQNNLKSKQILYFIRPVLFDAGLELHGACSVLFGARLELHGACSVLFGARLELHGDRPVLIRTFQ